MAKKKRAKVLFLPFHCQKYRTVSKSPATFFGMEWNRCIHRFTTFNTWQYLTYFFNIVFKSLLLHPSTRERKRFKSGACIFKTLHWNFFQKSTFESAFFGCLIGDDRQNAKQKSLCYRRSCKHASVDGALIKLSFFLYLRNFKLPRSHY